MVISFGKQKKKGFEGRSFPLLFDEYVFPGVFAGSDTAEGTVISIQGSYVVALVRVAGLNTGSGIAVWKNGELIKTLTAANLGLDTNKVYSVSISRSGKYIIVSRGKNCWKCRLGCFGGKLKSLYHFNCIPRRLWPKLL